MRLGFAQRRDPWWDLEGVSARRDRRRRQATSTAAFILAIVANGLTLAVWYHLLEPEIVRLLPW
jgi:hypothetical protein